MATVGGQARGRGGRGGGQSGGGGRGGGEMNNQRRGSWRGGPPGAMGHNAARGGSPVGGGVQPGAPGVGPNTPRVSINDHMSEMKKVQVEKPAVNKVLQTDTEISGVARASPNPRELQPWTAPDNGSNGTTGNVSNGTATPKGRGGKDNETFGTDDNEPRGKWDQFATNARLFGTTTSYQEEIYTTKLDKGGSDFRMKEREAERLAREIMGQSSTNMHIMDERNVVTDWADLKDDEEKYSGVQRDQPAPAPPTQRGPNAYVPPAARKSQGGGAGGPAAPVKATPTGPAAAATGAKTTATVNGGGGGIAPALEAGDASNIRAPGPKSTTLIPSQANTPAAIPADRSVPAPSNSPLPAGAAALSPAANPAALELKDGFKVVDAYRQFVDDEKGRVEAKKQAMAKTERERQVADLKSFQVNFKVPLPIPKDILPILSKDEDKQKTIEKNAQVSLQAAKDAKLKSPPVNPTAKALAPADMTRAVSSAAKPTAPASASAAAKKISMHIPEIPAFKSAAGRKPSMNAGTGPLPISESAKSDIPMTSPALSATASQTAEQAKLNPKAAAFVFKPTAAAFKPGQGSAGPSPAARPSLPSALAGPSVPKNPFFGDSAPGRVVVDLRADFNPFRHGSVPGANLIPPNWPYTGRPVQMTFMQPGHPMSFMEDEMTSPQFRQPQLMPGMQGGWFPQNRFGQPGMPPQQGMPPGGPMFSPVGPGYTPLPGMPQHMLNGPQGQHQPQHPQHSQHPQQQQHQQHPQHQTHLNHQQQMQLQQQQQGPGPHPQHSQHPGMPIYFPPNGMPQNPQFLPQHMQQQFNPASGGGPNGAGGGMPHSPQQRPGQPQQQPGQGGPPSGQSQGQGQGQGPPGMYYTQGQLPTPHHTPQRQHVLPFPPPPPGSTQHPQQQQQQHQFQPSPIVHPQMTGQLPQQGQGRPPSGAYEQQVQRQGHSGQGQDQIQGQGAQGQGGQG